MTDVTQLSDEALVDDCCVAFADAYDPSGGLLANVEAKVRWESHKAELLRRLAANARPEQVTLAMVQGMIDSLDYHAVLDYCGNIGVEIDDDSARYVSDCLRIDIKDALAALPWPTPQQDGAE